MVKREYEVELILNIEKINKKKTDKPIILKADKPVFRTTPTQNMVSASVGAILTSLTMTPLDVIKTRMQAQSGNPNKIFFYHNGLMDHVCHNVSKDDAWYLRQIKFSGTLDGFRRISQCEGIFSLWSGLGPTLALALPTTVLYFVAYEELKLWMSLRYGQIPERKQPLWIPMASASTARILTTFVSNPLELIRTQMQAESMSYLEIYRALKSILGLEGIGGLWSGVSPAILRDTVFSGIYWSGYEAIMSLDPESKITFVTSFFAGTTSGMISSVITTPFDVVKTFMQIQEAEKKRLKENRNMFLVFRKIYRENGVRGLFTGLTPRTCRVAPSCAIMVAVYEYGKSIFEAYDTEVEENS